MTAAINILFALVLVVIGIFAVASRPEPLAQEDRLGLFVVLGLVLPFLCLLAAAAEVVAWGVRRRRRWSWVAGIVVFVVHATSCLYWPMVGFGLWGLLDHGSQRELRRVREEAAAAG